MIAPGSVIGILGGGQLGRMVALAAAQLGYRCHIYAPEADPVAGDVAAFVTRGAYDDADALARFAASVAVVTYEFENVAAAPLGAIEPHAPLHPPARALEVAQDRVNEKTFAGNAGGLVTPWAAVDSRPDLDAALRDIGMPESGIDKAADLAVTNAYWNPRPLERSAIRDLISRAWAGEPPIATKAAT